MSKDDGRDLLHRAPATNGQLGFAAAQARRLLLLLCIAATTEAVALPSGPFMSLCQYSHIALRTL